LGTTVWVFSTKIFSSSVRKTCCLFNFF